MIDFENKESIRKGREERVLMEPELHEECGVISVLHPTSGRRCRLFKPDQMMQNVYDWLGSLSHDPLYFQLSEAHTTKCIDPDVLLKTYFKCTLQMSAVEEPIGNAKDESVTFIGHHVDYGSIFAKIDEKRGQYYWKLNSATKSIIVRRSVIFEDIFSAYKNDRDLHNHMLLIHLQNEMAAGDGVAREAYSIFVEDLFLKSFEGTSQFVPIIRPEFGEDEFRIVGEILYHFFINFGVFPIQLSRASLGNVFTGECSHSTLISSFLSFLPKSESLIINDTLHNGSFIHDDVISVLSNYGVRTNPSKQNVRELITKAAKAELHTKPATLLSAIKKPFGNESG